MKFRLFNLAKIKEMYVEQLEEFTYEYMFLFPFSFETAAVDFKIKQNERIKLITDSAIHTEHNKYTWGDLSLEELGHIIENILEPALLTYQIRRKGTLN